MKTQIIWLVVVLILSVGCSRQAEDKSGGIATVNLLLPSHLASSVSQSLNTTNQVWGFSQSVSALVNNWGYSDPTSLAQIGCYGVLVGGPEPELSGSYCTNSSSQELARFSVIGGLVANGSNIEVNVVPGTARRFYLIGMKLGSGACETMKGNEITKSNYSNPFILGSATADVTTGANTVNISAVNSFTTSNKIANCTFMSNASGSNLALNVSTKTLAPSVNYTFTATGGATPYTYTIDSGGGSINSSTGVYIAAASPGSAVVRVTDAVNSYITATVEVVNPGTLDTTFGTSGLFTFDSGGPDIFWDSALQSDGKIVSVGECYLSGQYDWCAIRQNSNGTLDTTFGSSGRWAFNTSTNEAMARSVKILSDGKYILGGQCEWNPSRICIMRLNSNGTTDTTFASSGLLSDDISGSNFNNRIYDMHLQSDGKLLVFAGLDTPGNGTWDFAVVKYNPDGTRDTSFNTTGLKVIDLGGDDQLSSGFVSSTGKIYLVGGKNIADGIVVRLNADGTLDSGFNGTGSYVFTNSTFSATTVLLNAVKEQSDGNVVVVGKLVTSAPSQLSFVARLTSGGGLDASFGGVGYSFPDLYSSSHEFATDVFIQPDGKILVSGQENTNNYAYVGRLTSSGSVDTGFGTSGLYNFTNIANFGSGNRIKMLVSAKGEIIVRGTKNNTDNDLMMRRLLSDSN
jgi:uncharacterized delta-60 repeat protein